MDESAFLAAFGRRLKGFVEQNTNNHVEKQCLRARLVVGFDKIFTGEAVKRKKNNSVSSLLIID